MGNHLNEKIEALFQVLDAAELSEPERLSRLSTALDALMLELHRTEYELDSLDYPAPPRVDYPALRRRVEAAFPSFGLYNTVNEVTESVGTTTLTIGDAVDDLADILRDLLDVQWRLKNTSQADGRFAFEESYRMHWGRHARDLQRYVFDLC